MHKKRRRTHQVATGADGPLTKEHGINLSENEKKLISSKVLTLEEVVELRALKKATEYFESNTILKEDKAGGFFSNLWGQLTGSHQQSCVEEANTLMYFTKVMTWRKNLKYFLTSGLISMRPKIKNDWSQGGHVAVRLANLRTKEIFVLDGWFEKGGASAHILLEQDWRNTPITRFKKYDFKDVVELINPKN